MDPIRIASRLTYEAVYAAALLIPGSKKNKADRAAAFAAKAEANAQKHAPAGIAIAVNLLVLAYLGTVKFREERVKDDQAIEATIEPEGFLASKPPGGAAPAPQMQVQVPPPTANTAALTAPQMPTMPDFAKALNPATPTKNAASSSANSGASGNVRPITSNSDFGNIANQSPSNWKYEPPKENALPPDPKEPAKFAFQFMDKVLEKRKLTPEFKKTVQYYTRLVRNGEYPVETAIRQTMKTNPNGALMKLLQQVKDVLDEAQALADAANNEAAKAGKKASIYDARGKASLIPPQEIEGYTDFNKIPGGGYGHGTGTIYGKGRDPLKNQKVLLLVPKNHSILAPFHRNGAEAEKLINELRSSNQVTIDESNLAFMTFAPAKGPWGYGDPNPMIRINTEGKVEIGGSASPNEVSIAIALEKEIANPQHDVVIIVDGVTFHKGSNEFHNVNSQIAYEQEAINFIPYLKKSGIRLYFVNYAKIPIGMPKPIFYSLKN